MSLYRTSVCGGASTGEHLPEVEMSRTNRVEWVTVAVTVAVMTKAVEKAKAMRVIQMMRVIKMMRVKHTK